MDFHFEYHPAILASFKEKAFLAKKLKEAFKSGDSILSNRIIKQIIKVEDSLEFFKKSDPSIYKLSLSYFIKHKIVDIVEYNFKKSTFTIHFKHTSKYLNKCAHKYMPYIS